MKSSSEINIRDEINKAIGVLKARMDCVLRESSPGDESWVEEYTALEQAAYSLEKWRDDEIHHHLPELAQQAIWFKQCQQCQVSAKETAQ